MKYPVFLLLIMLIGSLTAQHYRPDVTEMEAEEIIKDLKNSSLLVRLNMKKRTISGYENELARSDDPDYTRRLELELKELKWERKAYRENVISAFSDNYNFSKLYFVENQDFRELLKGKKTAFDKEGEPVSFAPDQNFYVLVQGDNDLQWIIKDHSLNELPPPFPARHGIGFKRVINLALGEDNANYDDLAKVAGNLNEALHQFYDKQN